MRHYPTITPEDETMGGALVAPLDLQSIAAAREKALSIARRAADALEDAFALTDEAAETAKGAHHGHHAYRSCQGEERHLNRLYRDSFDPVASVEAFRLSLDGAIWMRLYHETGLPQIMDRTERDRFEQDMRGEVPEATLENIVATFERLSLDADLMFKRGVARCFAELDPAFKSHDCFKIGTRMVFTHVFDDWGSFRYGSPLRAILGDIERVFSQLDGTPTWGSIEAALDRDRRGGRGPRQTVTETQYFKLRGFMNGNLHLWIRPECRPLLDKVNRVLASYYGDVLPDAAERADTPQDFRPTGTAVSKDLAFYPTPPEVADQFLHGHYIRPGDRVLEPSAGVGALVRPLLARGAEVDAIEVHPDRAAALQGIAQDNLRVRCANFLTVPPNPVYRWVVLNPPFCGMHWMDHVRHAFDFLGESGELIAILPASAQVGATPKHERFRAWAESHAPGRWRRDLWSDLPAESFASVGVRINTVILHLVKRS